MDQRNGFEYVPDPLGRLGRGEWRRREERDPFGRLPAAPAIDWLSPDGETMRSLGPAVRRLVARRLVRLPPPDPKAAAQFHREMDREEADPFWATPDPLWKQFLRALGVTLFGPPWLPENVQQVGGFRG